MKLHLPKTFLAAVLMAVAGMAAPAMAGVLTTGSFGYTPEGGSEITFSGTDAIVWNYNESKNIGTSGTNFSVGGVTYNGAANTASGPFVQDSSRPVGQGADNFWKNLTNREDFAGAVYGQTILMKGASQAVNLSNNGMGNMAIGGLITEATGAGAAYTLNGVSGNSNMTLVANESVGMNMLLQANTTISVGGTGNIIAATDGTWTVASGKTLMLTTAAAGAISFNDGVDVTVTGGGNFGFTGSIALNGSSSLTLADGTGIELGQVAKQNHNQGSGSGIQSSSTTYTLATGTGTVVKNGTVNLLLNGETLAGATIAEDNKSVTISNSIYHVEGGDTKTIAEANTAIAESGTTVDHFTVDGTLSGFSTAAHTTHLDIEGSGTVKVNGELQYHSAGEGHTYLNNFTGTLEIANGGVLQCGSGSTVLSNNMTLKVTEGGTVKSWGSGLAHAIVLDGGDLNQAGAATTYSGAVTVESSSSVTGTGATTTISGTTTVKAGTLTTHGNVTQSGLLDMNGQEQTKYTGSLVVADGTYTSTGDIWYNNTSRDITVKDGASFVYTKDAMTLTTKSGSDATISLTAANATNYRTSKGDFKISNADLVFASTANATLTNALENVSVTGGKTVDEETGAVTYKTTVTSSSMSNVTLNDVKLGTGTALSGVTLNNVSYATNATALGIGGTVNMGDFTNDMTGTQTNSYAIITNSGSSLNITGNVDLTKKSDGTQNVNDRLAVAKNSTLTVKDGGNLTTGYIAYSPSNPSNNGAVVVEEGGTLTTVNGDSFLSSLTNAGTATFNGGLNLNSGHLVNSGTLTLCTGNISLSDVELGGGTVSVFNKSSEEGHVYGVADEATLTVTHQLTVNASSTVNADIVVAANGVVSFTQGTVTLGCSVTFGEGSTVALGTAYLEDLAANGKVLLFTDVESYSDNLESIVVTGDFANGHLFAEAYTAEGGATKYNIYATPEPATATLSLLALAGLMARRRRH